MSPELEHYIKENKKLNEEIETLHYTIMDGQQALILQKDNNRKMLERLLNVEKSSASTKENLIWCHALLSKFRHALNLPEQELLDKIREQLYPIDKGNSTRTEP